MSLDPDKKLKFEENKANEDELNSRKKRVFPIGQGIKFFIGPNLVNGFLLVHRIFFSIFLLTDKIFNIF